MAGRGLSFCISFAPTGIPEIPATSAMDLGIVSTPPRPIALVKRVARTSSQHGYTTLSGEVFLAAVEPGSAQKLALGQGGDAVGARHRIPTPRHALFHVGKCDRRHRAALCLDVAFADGRS